MPLHERQEQNLPAHEDADHHESRHEAPDDGRHIFADRRGKEFLVQRRRSRAEEPAPGITFFAWASEFGRPQSPETASRCAAAARSQRCCTGTEYKLASKPIVPHARALPQLEQVNSSIRTLL